MTDTRVALPFKAIPPPETWDVLGIDPHHEVTARVDQARRMARHGLDGHCSVVEALTAIEGLLGFAHAYLVAEG